MTCHQECLGLSLPKAGLGLCNLLLLVEELICSEPRDQTIALIIELERRVAKCADSWKTFGLIMLC